MLNISDVGDKSKETFGLFAVLIDPDTYVLDSKVIKYIGARSDTF